MIPLEQLGIDGKTIAALTQARLTTVEQVGNCPHERLFRILSPDYCRTMILFARFQQWHRVRYPTPRLPHDWQPITRNLVTMNILVISVVVDHKELRHTPDGYTFCTLSCAYKYESDNKVHQTTLTAIARGNDFATSVHSTCPERLPVILQGEYERYKPAGEKNYRAELILTKQPITVPDFESSINKFLLVGRVGGDPDVKYFESGAVKASLTLATNRGKDEPPSWHNVEAWGQRAEVIANYVRKGDQIGFAGRLIAQSWRDRETGANRYKPLIKVEQVELLGSRRDA